MKINVPASLEQVCNRVVMSFGVEPELADDFQDVLEFVANCSNDDLKVIQEAINARKILLSSG